MASWLLGNLLAQDESASSSCEIVQLLRASLIRRPWAVLQHGRVVLKTFGSRSVEYWETAADMFRAALECGESTTARRILDRIKKRFPNSDRMKLMDGLILESEGRSGQAMDLYIHNISQNALSPLAYKRQIAVFKQQLKWNEAVALLNYYLSVYGGDVEAWTELCAISLRLARLSHALFAATELVAHDPSNYAYQLLLADVYMTCTPTVDNLTLAHQHYVASANCRKRSNLRALYGIWLTSTLLLSAQDGDTGTNSDHLVKMQTHAKNAIGAVYQSKPCSDNKYEHVRCLLDNYQNNQ